MAIFNRRTRHGAFEISSGNGLISLYALCKTRGEGGKPDPKLEALLADRAQRLKEKQEMAKLESSANSLASENRIAGTSVASPSVRGKSRQEMKRTLPKKASLA